MKEEKTINFLKMLDMTESQEISCMDVYELIDEYVELKRRGEDVSELMPKVKHHLDMCRDCFEEYEALMVALDFEDAAIFV
ncbi:MAG TPA: hypothetical protein EYP74_02770 [Anaerolineales bacterium]|nr:hypothetical protein [Anaerolineales bacterium]